MLKLTSLAVGLLSAMALLPASPAMAATSNPASSLTPAGDLHAQVILKIGPQYRRGDDRGYSRWEIERQRRLEWQREREARGRWRSGYNDRGRYDRGYRRDDERGYDRNYR